MNHKSECRCLQGFEGNPRTRCETPGCKSNDECPLDKACISRQCVNPCAYDHPCAPNAECFVLTHRPQCRCPQGLVGDPHSYCQRPVVEAEPECRKDADCHSNLACINEKCQNPCTVLNPCHPSAICKVLNTLPIRTTTCECPYGTIGSGYELCSKLPLNVFHIQ